MKFMSWSLNAPSSFIFDDYIQKINGEWQIINTNAIDGWDDSSTSLFYMYQKYNDKISGFGLHEFGVNADGSIYDYRAPSINVLNDSLTDVQSFVPTSLQYLMETYPNIDYSIQTICFGQKVDKFLHVNRATSIPNYINQLKKIAGIYRGKWNQINTIELDFEKIYTLLEGDPIYDDRDAPDRTVVGYAVGDDWNVYADFIKRIKDEVCIPLGMKLRVNMYAMTGDFTPYYYAWHDYKTLASRIDKNGERAINEFQIMSYDFSYAYSAPGPSTPIWWLKEILNHVDDSLPNNQTWIGNAGYGRRWGLDAQQPGSAVTYKQLLMWQNGMYVHSHRGDSKTWIWHDQPWLPFIGFNDKESGYQKTFMHLYDKFKAPNAKVVKGEMNYTTFGGEELITSYFKKQQPIFTNIHGVGNNSNISGNINAFYTGNGLTIDSKYLGSDYHFSGAYRANKAQYQYDEPSATCIPVPENTGVNGEINFNINSNSLGNHKLIALIHFNTFVNDKINCELNGIPFMVGGSSIDDWFPFYVDKYAWIEVGSFDFQTSNNIKVNPSSGYIWGFVICDGFDQNFLGGTVEFDSYLAPFKERGTKNANGIVSKVEANMPQDVILTGELLRRPPRPAIIFEDIFTYFLSSEGVGFDVSDIQYYMKTQDYWDSGSNEVSYNNAIACTDDNGIKKIGFTDGDWILQEDGRVRATTFTGYSNQLVLYKKFGANMKIRADIDVSGLYPKAGIRMLASDEGNANKGYLALLDYDQGKVVLDYEDGMGGYTEIASEYMSDTLINLKGETIGIYATIYEGKAYIKVGSREYLSGVDISGAPTSGAFGVYVYNGQVDLSLFNVSSIDRYEPLEKLEVEVDDSVYEFGEIERLDSLGNPIEYDDYGYLIYSGLNIEGLKKEKPEPSELGGSVSLNFEMDYQNLPLAQHPSWTGQKAVRVRMMDAGIWFTKFYIGDSKGYSVAYNSDYIGFIETSKLLFEHNCKGVAMWTMGQEDPLIFEYLPESTI